MWQAIVDGAMPISGRHAQGGRQIAFEPIRRWYLTRYFGIAELIKGMEALTDKIGSTDGVLIAPNHSHDSDPHVNDGSEHPGTSPILLHEQVADVPDALGL